MEGVKQWGVVIAVALVGVGLVGYGVWEQIKPREVKVEIIKSEARVEAELVVDVAGAVEKPGVYKLPTNSRIGDVLVLAGGLSARADRAWVAANLNLAQTLVDGEKVYIPTKEVGSENSKNQITNQKQIQNTNLININSASLSELDSLEGIGAVRAKAIIDNRPYGKTDELMTKAKIPKSVYEKIKDKVTVY